MARATGIQITGSTVRVVDIEGSPKKFKVRGFGESAIKVDESTGQDAALSKAIKEALKTAKAGRDHVIVGLPIRDCIVREITVPFTNIDQIQKVIKFESESHLHSCSIDDVVVCFHKVAESGNRSTLLIVAALKEKIASALLALERSGIDPLSVDIDASGLYSTVQCLEETAERESYVVCEIGYSSTLIQLIDKGELRLVRSVRMGTDSITARVSKDLDIDRDEARTRTQAILQQDLSLSDDLIVRAGDVSDVGDETQKSADELERDIIRQRQAELMKRLEQEIYRTINPAKLENPLEAIYLIGPGSNLPRLQSDLAELMSIPVRPLGVLEQMEHKFPAERVSVYDAVIPVATGLALKHLGNDPLGLDYRQEEFVFSKKFDRLKVPLMCLIVLLGALNFFWWYFEATMERQRARVLGATAKLSVNEFGSVMNPEILSKGEKEVMKVYADASELEATFLGAGNSNKTPIERIDYMGRNLKKMRDELKKAYGLRESNSKRKGRGSPRTQRGNKGPVPPPDVSEFVSALDHLQNVFQALLDTGVRDLAVNQLSITPNELKLALTLPEVAEIAGKGKMTYINILTQIEKNMRALNPGARFVDLDDRSKSVQREDGRGVDYKNVAFVFEKEVR